jgi:flagellar basal-body rod modification protein FlgD
MSSTDAISSTTTANNSSGFGLTTASQKALDRDAFLKLLVAQMKNQNPLEPQDNSQFVAELAQFSNLEQTQGINDRLDLLAIQSRGQSNAQVMSMIGQRVTVKGSIVTVSGNGTGTPINFTLGGDCDKSTVTIRSQSGDTIRTINVGAHKAGFVQLQWDGRDDTGLVQPQGSYLVSVKASNEKGSTISVEQTTTSTIEGIAFDTGYPVLQLANGATAPVSDLVRVENPPVGS